jgi:hypothetical protein
MTDRLAELRRQRLLICEHLAWLDREIGQIEGATAQSAGQAQSHTDPAVPSSPAMNRSGESPSPTRAEVALHAPGMAAEPSASVSNAEVLLEEFRAPPGAVKRDVRQGCLLYFAAAFVLLGIGIVVLYFTIGSR